MEKGERLRLRASLRLLQLTPHAFYLLRIRPVLNADLQRGAKALPGATPGPPTICCASKISASGARRALDPATRCPSPPLCAVLRPGARGEQSPNSCTTLQGWMSLSFRAAIDLTLPYVSSSHSRVVRCYRSFHTHWWFAKQESGGRPT